MDLLPAPATTAYFPCLSRGGNYPAIRECLKKTDNQRIKTGQFLIFGLNNLLIYSALAIWHLVGALFREICNFFRNQRIVLKGSIIFLCSRIIC
jgi:hypothetical protein